MFLIISIYNSRSLNTSLMAKLEETEGEVRQAIQVTPFLAYPSRATENPHPHLTSFKMSSFPSVHSVHFMNALTRIVLSMNK